MNILDQRAFEIPSGLNKKKLNPAKYELVITNKPEDTSKMKCSICKQDGHNKRSCKKITAPVLTPKIDASVKNIKI